MISPGASPVRRVLGAVVDSAATSYFMVRTGVNGLPLYVVYLWIIVGNGFRYGKAYLLNTLVLSGIGFSVVLYASPFWQAHLGVGGSLLLAMVALSMYVLTLVKRLNDAIRRAEAANLAKRQFVSTVSHEMRTPLNAIIGMIELLRDSTLSGEQAGMVKTIGASSRAMLGLIEDVLDFSKIEAGKLTIAKERFDLYALVNGVMQMLRAQAEAKGLSFVSMVMPDVPSVARGDEGHLRQVLINLLANAVKFTEQGGRDAPRLPVGGGTGGGDVEVLDPRHRDRHRAPGSAADLRELHPGRPDPDAAVRRHGSRHDDREAARGTHGRPHGPRERGRSGQHLLVRAPARTRRGRAARPGAGRADRDGGTRDRLPGRAVRADRKHDPRLGRRVCTRGRAPTRPWRTCTPRSAMAVSLRGVRCCMRATPVRPSGT